MTQAFAKAISPTAALFRRQGGNHLLIVGQNDEAAIGVMISTLLFDEEVVRIVTDRIRSFTSRFAGAKREDAL